MPDGWKDIEQGVTFHIENGLKMKEYAECGMCRQEQRIAVEGSEKFLYCPYCLTKSSMDCTDTIIGKEFSNYPHP